MRERGGHREAADLPVVIQQELAGDQRGEENAARQPAAVQAAGVLPSRADGELERQRGEQALLRHVEASTLSDDAVVQNIRSSVMPGGHLFELIKVRA